ncbi:hypothetical protein Salat_1476800 [Sesamum alatum]|uniref:Uncharacterized protein n=1 Tax=Sesamum alatum TaxID=300844 RepID=A0AAE1YBP3_9LAMI|nr:hypothetical protein Salat_1476800 [Sesamum alatum]
MEGSVLHFGSALSLTEEEDAGVVLPSGTWDGSSHQYGLMLVGRLFSHRAVNFVAFSLTLFSLIRPSRGLLIVRAKQQVQREERSSRRDRRRSHTPERRYPERARESPLGQRPPTEDNHPKRNTIVGGPVGGDPPVKGEVKDKIHSNFPVSTSKENPKPHLKKLQAWGARRCFKRRRERDASSGRAWWRRIWAALGRDELDEGQRLAEALAESSGDDDGACSGGRFRVREESSPFTDMREFWYRSA